MVASIGMSEWDSALPKSYKRAWERTPWLMFWKPRWRRRCGGWYMILTSETTQTSKFRHYWDYATDLEMVREILTSK
jgi:hypothetical protein